MTRYYFLSDKNEAVGPYTMEALAALASNGQITGETLVAAEGAATWIKWEEIKPPSLPPKPSLPASAGKASGISPRQNPHPSPQRCGLAVASLILGIVGLCLPAGIAAVICGHVAKSRIRKSAGALTGLGMAQAGLIIGYIWICMLPIGLVVKHFTMQHASITPGKKLADIRAKAEQGDQIAQGELADCYRKGQGVPKNMVEAVKWYRKASENEDINGAAFSQVNLAVCYFNGVGVAKDVVEGYKWALVASVRYIPAREQAKELAPFMTPEQITEAKQRANDWLQKRGTSLRIQ